MSNRESLMKQVENDLKSKMSPSESRHELKSNGSDRGKITSWTTFRTYLKHLIYYVKYVKDHPQAIADLGRKPRTLEECKPYCNLWINNMKTKGESPSTISMCASALVKLFQSSREELGVKEIVPKQLRKDIKRSRKPAVRDKNFNEAVPQNKILATFCRSTGLRRKELSNIRGSDLVKIGDLWYLSVTCETKGGRPRLSEIIGNDDEIKMVVDMCKKAGNEKIYPHPNTNADIHGFRADYASRIYKKYARPRNAYRNERIIVHNNRIVEVYISKDGKADVEGHKMYYTGKLTKKGTREMIRGYSDVPTAVFCRLDKKGVSYDRQALFVASENLGHSRDDVIVDHYLWS